MSDRRKMGYWEPFNTWWRDHVAKFDKRPNVHEMKSWYDANAARVWGGTGPTWEETKKHSKGMRRLEDIPDYFRKYRKGRKKKSGAGGDTSSSGGSDTEAMDSEGAPTPPRGGRGRGRGGAAAGRQRAASASQIPPVQPPPLGAPGGPPGLPSFFGLPGLPFLNAWRARSASSPVLPQMGGLDNGGGDHPHNHQQQQTVVAAELPHGLPFPINVASGHAAPPPPHMHLHPPHAGTVPLATAGGPPPLGRHGPFAGGPPPDPKLPPLQGSGGGSGPTASELFPPTVVENAFGNFMASLSDAVSDGSAPPSAAAHELMAGAAAAAAADAGGAGAGQGPSGASGAAPSLPLMDSALLMQVPSAALPPDMQVSEGRGVFGRLFSRNSTLKMVQSLFDRWATQEGAGGGAGAAGAGAPGEGTGGGPGPSDGTAAGPYGQQQQHHQQQQAYHHPHDPRRAPGAPGPYGGMQQQAPGGYMAPPPPGAAWGAPQHQQPVEAVGYITYAPGPGGYPQPGPPPPPPPHAVLGKRGREESNSSATTSAAAAGGPSRKLQRGLSGVFKPLLSMVSFGRRNRDATNAAAAAAVAAASGAHAQDGGGSGAAGVGVGAGAGGADGAPSLGLGALGLPSITDGPGGLLSAIDSKLFDGLPSLVGVDVGVDAEALSALAATLEEGPGGGGGGGSDGGVGGSAAGAQGVKAEARHSGGSGVGPQGVQREQQAAGEDEEEQGVRVPEQAVGVSVESHLPTPFVVPEMQERVAPGQQHTQQLLPPSSFAHPGGAGGNMAATVAPTTGSPQGWGPTGVSGGPGSSQTGHTVTTGGGGGSSGYASPHDHTQFYAPPPTHQGSGAGGSGAGPSGWGGAPPTALQPQGYHQPQQPYLQHPHPQQGYPQQPHQQYPYQLQQLPGQQQQQQQQQQAADGGQGQGLGGGSLLMKLSSTMSDVFKSLSWR